MAGPSSWNVLPVDLSSPSFSLHTFAKHKSNQILLIAKNINRIIQIGYKKKKTNELFQQWSLWV